MDLSQGHVWRILGQRLHIRGSFVLTWKKLGVRWEGRRRDTAGSIKRLLRMVNYYLNLTIGGITLSYQKPIRTIVRTIEHLVMLIAKLQQTLNSQA